MDFVKAEIGTTCEAPVPFAALGPVMTTVDCGAPAIVCDLDSVYPAFFCAEHDPRK